MRPYVLVYLYRKRLRVQMAQELLAGIGVAVAVALVFATLVENSSITGAARSVDHALVGSATIQLESRSQDGMDEALLKTVERLPGVKRSAPLLEETGTVISADGRRATVEIAGTTFGLGLINGLAHTLPISTLSPGDISLSRFTAQQLGVTAASEEGPAQKVSLLLRGSSSQLKVPTILGPETFGALSDSSIAVMPLARLQALSGLPRRLSRIIVRVDPGSESLARRELEHLAAGRLDVVPADHDLALLTQALAPSSQASGLFAAISALLGFLLAFNALLLTVPDRRQAIADLRIDGTGRAAIVQLVLSQGLFLGFAASVVGLLAGYALVGALQPSLGYLARSFTLGTSTVVGLLPVLLSLACGLLATSLASAMPLLDLRRGRALDAVYGEGGVPGNALQHGPQQRLTIAAVALLLAGSALFVLLPSAALGVCLMLALATVLAVPVMLGSVLSLAAAAARRYEQLTLLSAALTSLRATTISSLALAATGALALFGSVALGGSRGDLLRGIDAYTSRYVAAADAWVINPHDNQAIDSFRASPATAELARLPGVAGVLPYQGSFMNMGKRRVWVIALPPGVHPSLLKDQIIAGNLGTAQSRLTRSNWITVSAQLAGEYHRGVGNTIDLPTPTGDVPFRIAATTTNFGWPPGSIVMNTADYSRAWASVERTALGIQLDPGTNVESERAILTRALGPGSGLEVISAGEREGQIDDSAGQGLGQLGNIAKLLVLAAILALLAATVSSIWQRRPTLAALRLEGTRPKRLRRVLLIEVALMLTAGCITGVLAGIYGQLVIDSYLKNVTGFPVAGFATGREPLVILLVVLASVLAITSIPGWFASRVSPTFALDE